MIYHQAKPAKTGKPASSFVMAIFERGAVSFRLSAKATLSDIAERVGDIDALHIGAPVAIDVTVNPAARDLPRRAAPYLGTREFHW